MGGVALSLAAGTSLSPLDILAMEGKSPYYPPSLTGMRGSHAGSFEIPHAVSMGSARFERPKTQTEKTYDMVVVGGGISGLSAAHLYRQRSGGDNSVLVLDNHDDFGGHAKRNEFDVDGRTLIGYGGSQALESPGKYSKVSAQLLRDVGIHTERFYDYYDDEFASRHKLKRGVYFSADKYGRAVTAEHVFSFFDSERNPTTIDRVIDTYPIADESRIALKRLLIGKTDYLEGMSVDEKLRVLQSMSVSDFLRKHAGMPEEVVQLMRDEVRGYWGAGWDAISALEGADLGNVATRHLGLWEGAEDADFLEEPYIFHFPDGNASVARSLVRALIPDAIPGKTIEDLVTSVVDYSLLDTPQNTCRIRLNSSAVDVRHSPDQAHVDVVYIRDDEAEWVRAKHVVLACYNAMIPDICAEVPEKQTAAIRKAEKVPLVYTSVAVRNWHAWRNLGVSEIYQPQTPYMYSFGLDYPISVGDYKFTNGPDESTVLHGSVVMPEPDMGLTQREQSAIGRQRMYEMSFAEHERLLLGQLDGALAPGGFDAERDIAAITINRWPHGYADEYNDLFDPPDFGRHHGPHIAGRAQIGRISIANSDSNAYAYVDGAIDAADRAVNEQIAVA